MNKSIIQFIKRAIALALAVIVIDFALGKVMAHFYFKMTSGQTARITYAMTKANENMIVFGSSRANHNYASDILQDSFHTTVYNAGIDAQSILFHYCVLSSIKKRVQPEVVILDLNVDEFEASSVSYDRLYTLLPYYNNNEAIKPIVNHRSKFEYVKAWSNLYRYNSFVLPVFLNNVVHRQDDAINGYVPLTRTLDSNLVKSVARKPKALDSVKLDVFKSFLKEAVASNCKVFVFVSPTFRDAVNTHASLSIAEKICREANIPFVNYCNDVVFNNHPDYFQDPQHLNKTGAERYTKLVVENIKHTAAQ